MGWINEIKNAKRSRDTAPLMSVVIYGKRLSFDVFRFQITHYINSFDEHLTFRKTWYKNVVSIFFIELCLQYPFGRKEIKFPGNPLHHIFWLSKRELYSSVNIHCIEKYSKYCTLIDKLYTHMGKVFRLP